MKKLALIMLAAASLLATAGLAPAQYYYGGGYYYPAIATVILASTIGTTMVDITVDEATDMAAPSSDITRGASQKCGTQLDGAAGARGTTQSKTVCANCIADIDLFDCAAWAQGPTSKSAEAG